MKILSSLTLVALIGVMFLIGCSSGSKNTVQGSIAATIGNSGFSGNNCTSIAYDQGIQITGGNFTGNNIIGVFPIMKINLYHYQNNAKISYSLDSINNSMVYITTTDTFHADSGTLTIVNIVPTITGTFSCRMINNSAKDTAMTRGSFITSGL